MGQPDALQLPFLDELRRKFGGEGGILLPPLLLSGCDAYTSVIITFVCAGYRRIRSSATVSIVRWIFRVKRYQWYQSARSISRCISSAVRVCAFACLKSTLSRIALSAQLRAMSA
jgi:hypothetical protein